MTTAIFLACGVVALGLSLWLRISKFSGEGDVLATIPLNRWVKHLLVYGQVASAGVGILLLGAGLIDGFDRQSVAAGLMLLPVALFLRVVRQLMPVSFTSAGVSILGQLLPWDEVEALVIAGSRSVVVRRGAKQDVEIKPPMYDVSRFQVSSLESVARVVST